jgi:hypothetical protein
VARANFAQQSIFCFDFDESANTPSGLTVSSNGGAIGVSQAFVGGSPPNALLATASATGGRVIATASTIDLTKHKNASIQIDFSFLAPAAATTAQYVARANFAQQSSPIGLDGANGLQCGGQTYAALQPGVAHHVTLVVSVDSAGNATEFSCAVDSVASPPLTVVASATLSVELGNANAGAPFSVSYDDFVARAL